MENQPERVVLDRDDLRRTLVRIAHEIVEKNPGRRTIRGRAGDRRHPHPRRGARPPPARAGRRADRLRGPARRPRHLLLPRRPPRPRARAPSRSSTARTSTSSSTAARWCSSTTSSSPAAPCARRSTRSSTTAAPTASSSRCSPTAATASCRSAPTTWARTCRPRATSASSSASRRPTASTRWRSSRSRPATASVGEDAMRHLLSIEDLDRADIERIMDRAASFAEVGRRDIKKVPTLRGRTIVSLFYESSTRTSSSFELAAKRLSADVVSVKAARLVGGQGRVAQGHDRDPLRLRAGGDHHPLARTPGAAEAGHRLDVGRGRQRRRRQARAPEPGAARHLHAARPLQRARGQAPRRPRRQADLDRRRRPPQPRRPLLRARASGRWARRSRSAARRR